MREVDEKRRTREGDDARSRLRSPTATQRAPDLDEESEEDDGRRTTAKATAMQRTNQSARWSGIRRTASDDAANSATRFELYCRAPGAACARSPSLQSPLSYNHETLMALSSNSGPSQTRPQTGYSKTRPGIACRERHSQPHLAAQSRNELPGSSALAGDPSSFVLLGVTLLDGKSGGRGRRSDRTLCTEAQPRRDNPYRAPSASASPSSRSVSAVHSSLLLVQPTNSNGSSRTSAEIDCATTERPQGHARRQELPASSASRSIHR